jgi:hypothetical protein
LNTRAQSPGSLLSRVPEPSAEVHEKTVLVKVSKPNKLLLAFAVCLALGCGGRTAPDPDREALFTIVTDGALQRAHPCQEARDREASLKNGFLPESNAALLRERIEHAELSDVQLCLTQVRAYDVCFLSVSCDLLASSGALPAWLIGPEAAPCACGVDTEHLEEPFAEGPLPETLTACVGLLPISRVSAMPGQGAPCP